MTSLSIRIKHIPSSEELTFIIKGNDHFSRMKSLDAVLHPLNVYFGGEIELYDLNGDEHLANLISDPDELTEFLWPKGVGIV